MLLQERSDILFVRRAIIAIHHGAKLRKKLIRTAGSKYGYELARLIGEVYEGMGRSRRDIGEITFLADGGLVTRLELESTLYDMEDFFLSMIEVPPVAVPLPMLDPELSVVPGVGAS